MEWASRHCQTQETRQLSGTASFVEMIQITRDVVGNVSRVKVRVSAGRRAKRRCRDLIADLSSTSKFHVNSDKELDGRMSRRGLPDSILDSPGVGMDKGLDVGGLIAIDGQVHLH